MCKKYFSLGIMMIFFSGFSNAMQLVKISEDIQKEHLLTKISWSDVLNVRLVCRFYNKLIGDDYIVSKLKTSYPRPKNNICIFLDCVASGDIDAVEFLLPLVSENPFIIFCDPLVRHFGRGEDPNSYLTPMGIASYTGNQAMIDFLANKKIDSKSSPSIEPYFDLCIASCSGDIDAFNKAMKSKKQISKDTQEIVMSAALYNKDTNLLKLLCNNHEQLFAESLLYLMLIGSLPDHFSCPLIDNLPNRNTFIQHPHHEQENVSIEQGSGQVKFLVKMGTIAVLCAGGFYVYSKHSGNDKICTII